MLNFITQLLVLLITVSVTVTVQLCGNQDPQQTVDEAFIDSGIVKDLVIKLPSEGLNFIEVSYQPLFPIPSVTQKQSVSCGTQLDSFQTVDEPLVKFPAKSNTNYTFMMLDIDAPSPSEPTIRSFIHWMVVNAYGGHLKPESTVHSYISPMPTPGSGAHRYVFMVFEQPEGFTIEPNVIVLDRNNFNVAKWVEQNTVFGPVAGNYFLEGNPMDPKFNILA